MAFEKQHVAFVVVIVATKMTERKKVKVSRRGGRDTSEKRDRGGREATGRWRDKLLVKASQLGNVNNAL